MVSNLTDIERARINRADDNSKVTVRDILRAALDDLDRGELVASSCLLIFVDRPEVGDWSLESYRANITRDEEVSTLTMAQHRALHRWEKD